MQTTDQEEIPEEFICPIKHSLMIDPVLMKDGNTYERSAIEEWTKFKNTSPLNSDQGISMNDAIPNRLLKALIEKFTSKLFELRLHWKSPRSEVDKAIMICLKDTVKDLKTRIEESLGIPRAFQTVTFQKEALEDDSVRLYDLVSPPTKGDCVDVQCPHVQFFVKDFDNRSLTFQMFPFETYGDLQDMIQNRSGLPPAQQTIKCGTKILTKRDLTKTIEDLGVQSNWTLWLQGRMLGGSHAE
jgi:hypothetical protein